MQLSIRRTLIFRVDLLHTSDFIGSECRCESTTRNIQELRISGNKLRLALGTVSGWWSQTPLRRSVTGRIRMLLVARRLASSHLFRLSRRGRWWGDVPGDQPLLPNTALANSNR